MLPQAFKERMMQLLGDEYDAFIATYDDQDVRGARINTLKINPSDYLDTKRLELEPIPYAHDCYKLISDDVAVGRLPEHHAGIIYMQDPGAMAALGALDIPVGAKVLDLCAAPGGNQDRLRQKSGIRGCLYLTNTFRKEQKLPLEILKDLVYVTQ